MEHLKYGHLGRKAQREKIFPRKIEKLKEFSRDRGNFRASSKCRCGEINCGRGACETMRE